MQISATGTLTDRRVDTLRAGAQRGVTLVEFLIVLAILAMVTGVVVANAPQGRSEARRAAERFAAALDRAAQMSIAKGVVIGLDPGDDGFRFLTYEKGEWRDAGRDLPKGAYGADVSATVEVREPAKRNEPDERRRDSRSGPASPKVRFWPTGETTAATATFQSGREIFEVNLDEAGNIGVRHGE